MLTQPAPALIKMLARQVVAAHRIRYAGAVHPDLGKNAQLLFGRRAPAPFHNNQDFMPHRNPTSDVNGDVVNDVKLPMIQPRYKPAQTDRLRKP